MLQIKLHSLRRAGTSRSFLLASSLLAVCGLAPQVHAEGGDKGPIWGGNHGVNRVVWTNPYVGYYAVEGEFTLRFGLPTIAGGWELTNTAKKYFDEPTCYLGAAGTSILDSSSDQKTSTSMLGFNIPCIMGRVRIPPIPLRPL